MLLSATKTLRSSSVMMGSVPSAPSAEEEDTTFLPGFKSLLPFLLSDWWWPSFLLFDLRRSWSSRDGSCCRTLQNSLMFLKIGVLVKYCKTRGLLESYACPDQGTWHMRQENNIQQIFASSVFLSNSMMWKLDYQHSQNHS